MPVYRVLLLVVGAAALTACTNLQNGLERTFSPSPTLSTAPPPPSFGDVPPPPVPPPPMDAAGLLPPQPVEEIPAQAVTRAPEKLYNMDEPRPKAAKRATASADSSASKPAKEQIAVPVRSAKAETKSNTAVQEEEIDTSLLATPVRKGARKQSSSASTESESSSKSPQSNLLKKAAGKNSSKEESVDILPVSSPANEERVNFRNFS